MRTPTLSMKLCTETEHYFSTVDSTICRCGKRVKLSGHFKKMQLPQLSLDFLQNSFQVKPVSKTFKTTPRDGISLEDCFKDANKWLRNQSEYTRVEFPYDGYYYVVAKLSEAK